MKAWSLFLLPVVFLACGLETVVVQSESTDATETSRNDARTTPTPSSKPSPETPVTIHVSPVKLSTKEDSPVKGSIQARSSIGRSLTYSITIPPKKGVLAGEIQNGHIEYQPNPNQFGEDSFGLRISDGVITTTTTATVIISSENDLPIAKDLDFETLENVSVTGAMSVSDVDGQNATFRVVGLPTKGHVTLTDASSGKFSYSPHSFENGLDSFTYLASDGFGNSNIATVRISITPVNQPPVSFPISFMIQEDNLLTGTLPATDPDGDPLTFFVKIEESLGRFQWVDSSKGTFTLQPQPNLNGTVTFAYGVSDGSRASDYETVTLTIDNVNDPPTISDISTSTMEDYSFEAFLDGFDIDTSNDHLVYSIHSHPSKGSASIIKDGNRNKYRYRPSANANGIDTFIISLSDGSLQSFATVTIRIDPVNDRPIPADGNLNISEDVVSSGQLVGVDIDSTTLTFKILTLPAKGTVTITNSATGTYTYTPNANATGNDVFSYGVSDDNRTFTVGTIQVRLDQVNDAPVANSFSVLTPEDQSKAGFLEATDVDGDSLVYSIATNPTNGKVTVAPSTGAFIYTPTANFYGQDSFQFKVQDGSVDSNVGTVSVSVSKVNDTPVALSNSFVTEEDKSFSGKLRGSDIDGDAITYSAVGTASLGSVRITNPSTGDFTFTPTPNSSGDGGFFFRTFDGAEYSSSQWISLTITPINDPPTVQPQSLTVTEDFGRSGRIDATDVDSSNLLFQILSTPLKGSVVLTNSATGAYSYTPRANANGTDSFEFSVSDGSFSVTGTVKIEIQPVNDPPSAYGGSVTINEDDPLLGRVVANDPDQDVLVFLASTPPQNGSLQLNSSTGEFTYTPRLEWSGQDGFTIFVSDGKGGTALPSYTVNVLTVNDPPRLSDATMTVEYQENPDYYLTTATISLIYKVWDDYAGNKKFSIVTQATHGKVFLLDEVGGVFAYQPNSGLPTTDSFQVKVNDGVSDSLSATVRVVSLGQGYTEDLTRIFGGPSTDSVPSIASSKDGNIILAQSVYRGDLRCSSMGSLTKVNVAGDSIWSKSTNILGENSCDGKISDVGVDDADSIYVGGLSPDGSYFIASHDSSGSIRWKSFSSSKSVTQVNAAFNRKGESFLLYMINNPPSRPRLAKYSEDGKLAWEVDAAGLSRIAASEDGGVVGFSTTNTISKFSPSGTTIWTKNTGLSGQTTGTVAQDGRIYIVGNLGGYRTVEFYSPDGTPGNRVSHERAKPNAAIALGPNNEVFVLFTESYSNSFFNASLHQYSRDLNLGWTSQNLTPGVKDLAVSGTDNVFAAGLVAGQAGSSLNGQSIIGKEDGYLIKFGPASRYCKGAKLTSTPYAGGTGDYADPFKICSAKQLNAIGGRPQDWNLNFVLKDNIDLSSFDGVTNSFQPIGGATFSNTPFTGGFDGNGYEIRNLKLSMAEEDNVGLFRIVRGPAKIRNLGFNGVNVTGKSTVGTLVGYAGAGSTPFEEKAAPAIQNIYAINGTVTAKDSQAGGLVGNNHESSIVTESFSNINVSAFFRAGGIAGSNWGTISNCYSSGSVNSNSAAGGLVGYLAKTFGNGGIIDSCYASGPVSSQTSLQGGLLGQLSEGTINSSFWDKEVTGQTLSPGSNSTSGKTTLEMKLQDTFAPAGATTGWDFVSTWVMSKDPGYPVLRRAGR
ncbi:MAG: hypothetical protein RIQ81_1382 [Pseudomonadota bacterium]|jgi:hypothetical protein